MDAMDSRQRVVIDFVELGFMRRMEMGRVVVPVIEGRSSAACMTWGRGGGWLWRVGFDVGGAGCDAWVAGCCVVVGIESVLSVRSAGGRRCGLVGGLSVVPVGAVCDIRCGLTRSPSVLSDLVA